MSDLRKAAEMALKALNKIVRVNAMDYEYKKWAAEAHETLQEALAQPEEKMRVQGSGKLTTKPYPDGYGSEQQFRQALAQPEQEPDTVMAKYEFQTYAAYKTDGEMKIGVVPELRQALAQPEQKPVGTYEGVMETMLSLRKGTLEQQQIYTHMKDKLLYTAQPKREWVGLTRRELDIATLGLEDLSDCYKAIEAKLKEKNT